jgi:hypothetical protein
VLPPPDFYTFHKDDATVYPTPIPACLKKFTRILMTLRKNQWKIGTNKNEEKTDDRRENLPK